jgi:hypothetical protein
VKFLISRGVNVHDESSIMTPLELAAFRGYTIILKILLEHNADVICQIYYFFCCLSTLVLYFPLKPCASLLSPIIPNFIISFSVLLMCEPAPALVSVHPYINSSELWRS